MHTREQAVDRNPATRETVYGARVGPVCDPVGPVEPTEPTTGVAEVGRRTEQTASRGRAVQNE